MLRSKRNPEGCQPLSRGLSTSDTPGLRPGEETDPGGVAARLLKSRRLNDVDVPARLSATPPGSFAQARHPGVSLALNPQLMP